ncbi:hypothetical protein [Streptomyces exfoliatus]|uniref:hypothetical protein n=1 Tax=Streptomyces exfoliatus TaxID=1905 RepID=UPI0004665692|nr:hypothetical protein [Streptomyces exfoliatus]
MRSTVHKLALPAVVLVMAAVGCTPGSDSATPEGQSASEVCGGFAADPAVASALEAIAGKGASLKSDGSEPERVLTDLRKAARTPQNGKKSLLRGIPFCNLETAGDEKNVLNITLREALAVPKGDSVKEFATFYSTGRRATSALLHASIYFTCRMPAPAHEIVLVAELDRADENEADHPGIRDEQITLANAAAHQVSAELGCEKDGLATGVPSPTAPPTS